MQSWLVHTGLPYWGDGKKELGKPLCHDLRWAKYHNREAMFRLQALGQACQNGENWLESYKRLLINHERAEWTPHRRDSIKGLSVFGLLSKELPHGVRRSL